MFAFAGKLLAVIGKGFSFGGEVFLAFEEFYAVAAHQLHLLGELVLPGGHLFELLLEDFSGVQDGVLAAGAWAVVKGLIGRIVEREHVAGAGRIPGNVGLLGDLSGELIICHG